MHTKPIPYSQVPSDIGDYMQYAGPGGLSVCELGTPPPVIVDKRPWCLEHGLMAQGFDEWYCEECEATRRSGMTFNINDTVEDIDSGEHGVIIQLDAGNGLTEGEWFRVAMHSCMEERIYNATELRISASHA